MKSSGIGKRVQIVYKVNNSSPFWIRQEWITRIPVNQTNSVNFIAVVKVSCFARVSGLKAADVFPCHAKRFYCLR